MNRKPFHHESTEVRRKELIAATLDCIGRLGLKGATVREIAKSAGVTGGLIRHYFTSKELLFQAAYGDLIDMMSATAVRQAEEAGPSPRQRLRTFIEANFRPPLIDPQSLSLWATFIGQLNQDPSLVPIHRKGYLDYRDRLERLLSDALSEAGSPPDAAELRAHSIAITGIIDGLWLEACMAADLFAKGELGRIAIRSVERLIGVPLLEPDASGPDSTYPERTA